MEEHSLAHPPTYGTEKLLVLACHLHCKLDVPLE
jgi:hypothetical protein